MRLLRKSMHVTLNAFYAFLADDGWAIASHIALSVLMALFPFLIVVTALAGYFGTKELAEEVRNLILDTWPAEVAGPIASEISSVLTTTRGGVLTLGVVFSVYFASSGIESLRIGLNRAYNMAERRAWWLLRLESIAYVLLGAVALLSLAFLIVLGPLIFATALRYAPWLEPLERTFNFIRYAIASIVLIVALLFVHLWLPAGKRRLSEIAPGVVVTLLLWLATGIVFGRYLAEFANTYVTTYAGLASAMVALVFLYWTASIFVFGGELNAEIMKARTQEKVGEATGG
ncbi:MAG TPA: YihY/virulence factor BrkB family protein [Xanthobacteraceae bacterium]|nr:YihY/virulence factor BrkB family protein [Xanthobacteraceae bacterium]